MYTAQILRKSVDKQNGLLFIDVAYLLDGGPEPETTEQMRLPIDITMDDIARKIKDVTTRLEKYEVNNATIEEGEVNLSVIKDTTVTQAEKDKQDWFRDFGRLNKVQELVSLKVLTGSETAVTALHNKVKTNFKPAYIADM